MCRNAVRDRNVFVVSPECHPQTIEVIRTRARPLGLEIVVGDRPQAILQSTYVAVGR